MERVVFVKPLHAYVVELTFADGHKKIVDIQPFIGEGISAALLDESFFQEVQIESGGGIYWPNGYDFCPNFLRYDVPAVQAIEA
jgi:hypothetical protein